MKTFAFIDGSNIIYSARAEGWHIDQKKLFDYLKRKFRISKAFFYYGKDGECFIGLANLRGLLERKP